MKGWLVWATTGAIALAVAGARAQVPAPEQQGEVAGVFVEDASAKQKLDAGRAYDAALAAYQAGDKERALEGFRASYAIVASPNSHLMIGRVLSELGHAVEAYLEVERALAEAQVAAARHPAKYAKTVDALRVELAELRKATALVTVTVTGETEGAALFVAGRAVPRSDWGKPWLAPAGEVAIVLETPRGEVRKLEELPAGGEVAVTLSSPPLEPQATARTVVPEEGWSGPPRKTLALVGAGVGVVGMGLTATFGALSSERFSRLEDRCRGDVCERRLEDVADEGQTFQALANTSLVVGLVGFAAGAGLWTWGHVEGEPGLIGADDTQGARVSVGAGAVWLEGAF